MTKKKISRCVKTYLSIPMLILFSYSLRAQIFVNNEEQKRLYYSFAVKRITNFWEMKDFRDVFHKDKYWMGKNKFSGNISYNTGRVLIDDGHETHKEYRSALGFYLRWRFYEQFSISTTLYWDFNKAATARWTSDYAYSIGRFNWKPRKLSYGYENYINNKYTDNIKLTAQKFLEGFFFVSYSTNLAPKLRDLILLDNSTQIKFNYFVRYAIHYRDENDSVHGDLLHGKPSVGISARYTIYKNIYIESGLYYYIDPKQRQPWDPDFSYGFGYFDWRSFRISLTYGNWAINHFPWDKTGKYPSYGFLDGQFRIIANWIW
jgi:hypothetical protein